MKYCPRCVSRLRRRLRQTNEAAKACRRLVERRACLISYKGSLDKLTHQQSAASPRLRHETSLRKTKFIFSLEIEAKGWHEVEAELEQLDLERGAAGFANVLYMQDGETSRTVCLEKEMKRRRSRRRLLPATPCLVETF